MTVVKSKARWKQIVQIARTDGSGVGEMCFIVIVSITDNRVILITCDSTISCVRLKLCYQ